MSEKQSDKTRGERSSKKRKQDEAGLSEQGDTKRKDWKDRKEKEKVKNGLGDSTGESVTKKTKKAKKKVRAEEDALVGNVEELEKIGVELARVLEGGPKEKGKKEKKGKKKVKEEEEEGEEGESATLKKDKKDKKDMKRDKKDKKDMKRGKKDDVVTEGESPTLNDKKDKKIKKKGKKERKEAKEKPNSEDSKPPAAQKEAPDLTKRTTTPAVATTTYRGGPIHTSKPMGPVHTDWAAAQLQGGDARKAKFLRLLGAKPQPTTSTLDSTKPKTTSGVDLSVIRKREKDLEHQFNTGLMMKTEPGSKRRGLGA